MHHDSASLAVGQRSLGDPGIAYPPRPPLTRGGPRPPSARAAPR
ncbi:hypothetical protein AB0J42_27260 [Nonomuraea sp. NPDC049649]